MRTIVPSGGGRIVAGQMNELRHLQAGSELATALLLTDVQPRVRRDGSELLRLKLADRTATVDAIVLDRVDEVRDACQAGAVRAFAAATRKVNSSSLPGVTRCSQTRAAKIEETTATEISPAIRNLRLSTMSTSAPAGMANRNSGTAFATWI